MLRPGNFDITRSAAEAAGFKKGDKILDVGCGRGETMRFLTDEYGLDCVGVDMNLRFIEEGSKANPDLDIRLGDGEFLDDFSSKTFDGVFMECVLSLINMPDEALHEAYCVLKKGGRLILSDLFHINPERNFIKAVRIEADRQAMRKRKEGECEERTAKAVDFRHDGKFIIGPLGDQLEEMGFIITHFEDRTEDLTQYMAETILDGKEDSIICNVKNKKNTGYFMLVAQKR